MLVISWAQMGYLRIQVEPDGRILLHKRMEMGNERGNYEMKLFRSLFGKKQTVDSASYHYAQLCRKVAASQSSLQEQFHPSSGNPMAFRVLAAAAGVFGGASVAIGLAGDALLAILVILLMSLLGGIAAFPNKDFDSYIGFILGTGTNTCYVEQCARIGKLPQINEGTMAVNMETGGFDGFV